MTYVRGCPNGRYSPLSSSFYFKMFLKQFFQCQPTDMAVTKSNFATFINNQLSKLFYNNSLFGFARIRQKLHRLFCLLVQLFYSFVHYAATLYTKPEVDFLAAPLAFKPTITFLSSKKRRSDSSPFITVRPKKVAGRCLSNTTAKLIEVL